MTPAFSARRRADEFEALLARGPGARASADEAERFGALLGLVADLRAVPAPQARPEFVDDLRARLMAEADTVLVRQPTAPQRLAMPTTSRGRDRRVGAVLGGLAMVGAAATMAVASQGALPGESLYGVKRGIESAEVRLADGDAARGRTLLAQAGTRLDELEELAAADRGDDRLVPETLDAFTRQSGEGVRSLLSSYDAGGTELDVEHARAFAATSLDRLGALESSLPSSARDQLVAAGQTLADLDEEAGAVCPACSGGITEVPPFLLSSAPVADLLSGLDADRVRLEAAPVPTQDLDGITVPPQLLPSAGPGATQSTGRPTSAPTSTTPLPPLPSTGPGTGPSAVPTGPGGGTGPLNGVTGTVTGTTSGLTQGVDDLTGGAVGGLTGTVDNATGGLIGELTGTVDGLTGNTLGNATGGLLP